MKRTTQNSLTLEEVLAIVDKVAGRHMQTQTAVPTVQVQKDSFESFTGAALKGWPFFLAMASIAFWIMQSIYGINSTLNEHESRISQTEETLVSVDRKIDSQATASNDIIRRLDNLQKDIEILKTK